MGKINVLGFDVANLIAAGEVVDRPASVIKELLENSVDAGADNITVEIQNGGVSLMRVSDNGCGMSKDDLPISIKRHATSKIKTADDLDGITTLGFRGEALAAISSVSNIRIISKQKESAYGAILEAAGGEITNISERGCADGTTVIVENLFANVPARRKFLKKDNAEAMAVSVVVEKIALSRPDIAFKLIIDGMIKLETVGDGKLKNTVYAIFGRDFTSKIIEINNMSDGIGIRGFIGRSDNVKANRNYQNFFINGRYVKSKTACAAIEQAYCSYIPPEKFPVCILYIDINPKIVDVNVHPAKLEVKFSNEKPVFEAIYYAVRSALEENKTRPEFNAYNSNPTFEQRRKNDVYSLKNSFVPIVDASERTKIKESQIDISNVRYSAPENIPPHTYAPINIPASRAEERKTEYVQRPAPEFRNVQTENKTEATVSAPAAYENTVKVEEENTKSPLPEYKIIGEAFNFYIIVEAGNKLLMIDKHAAHERIIFESLKENMRKKENSSQLLMIPVELNLASNEYYALSEYKKEIYDVGFEILYSEEQKKLSVIQIPCGIEAGRAADILSSMAQKILEGTGNPSLTKDIIFEKALYQGSCKAAIKAGREYPEEYNEWIVKELQKIPNITFCPHGRPVAIEISKKTLDKQFSRI